MDGRILSIIYGVFVVLQIGVPSCEGGDGRSSPSNPMGLSGRNRTKNDLGTRERYRRLIPYMTFYLTGTTRSSPTILYQTGQEARPVVALGPGANNGGSNALLETGGFYPIPPPHAPNPPHSTPSPQPHSPVPSLSSMIASNYLALSKQANTPIHNRFNVYQPYKVIPLKQPRPYTLQGPIRGQQKSRVEESGSYRGSFIPSHPDTVTITQSQEIPIEPARLIGTPPPQLHSQPSVQTQQQQYMKVSPIQDYRQATLQRPVPHQQFLQQTYIGPADPLLVESYQTNEQQNDDYQEQQGDLSSEAGDGDEIDENLNNILQGYQLSKALPERITPENLDSSIRTLSKILRILQRAHALPQSANRLIQGFPRDGLDFTRKAQQLAARIPPRDQEGSTPGRAGIDYPAYTEIPQTHFSCKQQRYKGFFGDPETGCQVWHYCDLNGGQASFLCPNGTIFSQAALTCDWWFNVKCASTAQLYVLNERLYKYILPQRPSWPEDYAGPLVDSYLKLKYEELERNRTEEARSKERGEEQQSLEDSEEIDDVSRETDEEELSPD